MLLSMLCTCETSFAHVYNLTGNTRPENTVTSMTQGEFRATMGDMELVENILAERGWDDDTILFKK